MNTPRLGTLALALACAVAHAQQGLPPVTSMPPGKIPIDPKSIPGLRTGFRVLRTNIDNTQPVDYQEQAQDPTSAFRTWCKFVRFGYFDPIVYPGRGGPSHLHVFFGNNNINAGTTFDTLMTTGASGCAGGTLNRSAYWIPSLLLLDDPALPFDRTNPAADGLAKVIPPSNVITYYKLDAVNVPNPQNLASIAPVSGYPNYNPNFYPPGLRMIAGNPNATSVDNGSLIYYFDFYKANGTDCSISGTHFRSIPTSAQAHDCDFFEASVNFPQCWNGVDLDVPGNHNAHMAFAWPGYGTPNNCPSTHPYHFPNATFTVRWKGINPAWYDRLRFSSDPPPSSGQPAGWTFHGDWFGAWDRTTPVPGFNGKTILEVLNSECWRPWTNPQSWKVAGSTTISANCEVDRIGSPDGVNWHVLSSPF